MDITGKWNSVFIINPNTNQQKPYTAGMVEFRSDGTAIAGDGALAKFIAKRIQPSQYTFDGKNIDIFLGGELWQTGEYTTTELPFPAVVLVDVDTRAITVYRRA